MSRKKIPISELDLSLIGDRIAYIRRTNDLTQTEFSEKTGISKGNLSGLENHKYEPSFGALVKILDLFQINSTWLLTGTGERYLSKTTPLEGVKGESKSVDGQQNSKDVVLDNDDLQAIYMKGLDQKLSEMVARTVEILESDTMYQEALACTIMIYYHALENDKMLRAQNTDLQVALKNIQKIMSRQTPPPGKPERRGCVDEIKSELEKDEIKKAVGM